MHWAAFRGNGGGLYRCQFGSPIRNFSSCQLGVKAESRAGEGITRVCTKFVDYPKECAGATEEEGNQAWRLEPWNSVAYIKRILAKTGGFL